MPECIKLDNARVCHNITGLLFLEGEMFELLSESSDKVVS